MSEFCRATSLTKRLSRRPAEVFVYCGNLSTSCFLGVCRMLRLMVADVDSPSYFVATAAVELGFFKQEGIDIEFELVYGARSGPERLRDGTLHFFGGPAYAATRAFPAWKGARLLCALAQYSYWFMAVRADIDV